MTTQNQHRIVLGIEYDGCAYQGYQKQPHGQTIQNQLENAIFSFTQQKIVTHCAGRTDAGVHALEQVVHLDTTVERAMQSWVRGLNAHLPKDITVNWAKEVPCQEKGFHARSSAISRTYRYLLINQRTRSSLWQGRAGWVFRELDLKSMQQASQCLLGEHDFTSFRCAECQSITPVKTLYDISIEQSGALFTFTFTANAFLQHMIRNIVGSLIYIGQGVQPVTWMQTLLDAKNRSLAAPTFMPDGLYLTKVNYDEKWGLPKEIRKFP